MGSGRWSAEVHHSSGVARARAGVDTFDYSGRAIRSGDLRPHQTLDPQNLRTRESRDSVEHPTSNAIIISLDVTGSMSRVVRGIHQNLPQLHELLLGHQYIPDPQIMFAAIGDATCDRVPLQVGQFESDNRMDQNLENMILEGGGGGHITESYELMLYIAARHSIIDCWEKRRRKGYFFMIGDEIAYPSVKRLEVQRLIGGGLQTDVPLRQIVEEVKQRYHLYYVIPGGAAHGNDREIVDFWRDHIGPQQVIQLDRPELTSQSIGLTIGINEGAVGMNEAAEHMRSRGVVGRTIDGVIGALSTIFTGSSGTSGADGAPRSRRL